MAAWRGDLENPQNVHYHNGAPPPLLLEPKWIRLAFLGMGTLSTLFIIFFALRAQVCSLSLLQGLRLTIREKKERFFRKMKSPRCCSTKWVSQTCRGWKEKIGGVASSSPPCRKAVNLRPNSNELLPTALLLPTTSSLRFSQRLRRERDA